MFKSLFQLTVLVTIVIIIVVGGPCESYAKLVPRFKVEIGTDGKPKMVFILEPFTTNEKEKSSFETNSGADTEQHTLSIKAESNDPSMTAFENLQLRASRNFGLWLLSLKIIDAIDSARITGNYETVDSLYNCFLYNESILFNTPLFNDTQPKDSVNSNQNETNDTIYDPIEVIQIDSTILLKGDPVTEKEEE